MSNINQFFGVGDRVVDTLLVYSLSDLARRVDARSSFKWSLGRDVIFELHSSQSDILDKMLKTLKSSGKSVTIANRLNFLLNIGGGKGRGWKVDPITCVYCAGKKGKTPCNMRGGCGQVNVPAYPIFFENLNKIKTLSWIEAYVLSKRKQMDYGTLYVGLSPYWSKGVRRWDSDWESPSTYLPLQIQALLLYGLGNYVIITPSDTFAELIFSPPLGTLLEHTDARRILELVKRVVNKFSIGVRGTRISELPIKTIPLVLISQIDLPAIAGLSREQLSLLFVAYDLDKYGVPKNARGYEEWSLGDISNFYLNLGTSFWDFKCMIEDLASQVWRDDFRARIQNILIDLSSAISRRDIWLLNDALLKAKRLTEEGIRIHLLTQESTLKAQQVLKTF